MSTQTTNYGLEKPDVGEYYNVEVFNNNADLIDTALQKLSKDKAEQTAVDELKKSVSDGKTLVAGAITGKGVNTATDATFATMADNISAIQVGIDTSDATATAGQILRGASAYVGDSKIIGSMPNNTGAITGWCGYETVTVQAHPVASDQALVTVPNTYSYAGYYDRTSSVTANIANLNSSNIRAGVLVGRSGGNTTNCIAGTFTADANATAGQILYGRTAYVNGNKVTGSMNNVAGQYAQPVSMQMNTNLDIVPAEGYYNGSNAYVALTPTSLASVLGITANKILAGNTICGVAGTAISVYSATVTTTTNTSNTFITVDYRGSTTSVSNSIASFTTSKSSYEQLICTYVSNSGTSTGSFSGANYNVKAIVVPNIGICFYIYRTGDTYYSSFHTYGSPSPYYWVTDNGNGTYTHNITLALLASGSSATIKAY